MTWITDMEAYRGEIHRGAGVVARLGNLAVVTPNADTNFVIDEYYAELGTNPTHDHFVEITENKLFALGALGAVYNGDSGLTCYVYGAVTITVNDRHVITGSEKLTSSSVTDSSVDAIRITSVNDVDGKPLRPYDIRFGVSPGAGLTIAHPDTKSQATSLGSIQRANHSNRNESETSADQTVSTSSGITRTEQAGLKAEELVESTSTLLTEINPAATEPLPLGNVTTGDPKRVLVNGVNCPKGHLNPPDGSFCRLCGVSISHLSEETIVAERPTLGFIIFDDGSTFGLDRSYVMGRQPASTSDHVEPLRIHTDHETVSRNHAVLTLDEWAVKIVDQGSTNGTFIWDADKGSWAQLKPNVEVEILSGTTIALGRRAFVYESVDTADSPEKADDGEEVAADDGEEVAADVPHPDPTNPSHQHQEADTATDNSEKTASSDSTDSIEPERSDSADSTDPADVQSDASK